MIRTLGVCGFLLLACAAVSSDEDYTSGNWLLGSCTITVKGMDDKNHSQDVYESYRDGWCRGIVAGVSDASPKVCPDANVIHGQAVRVVLKYLQDHPEELHVNGSALAEKALARAFPCKAP
jgi:hypothetical protein